MCARVFLTGDTHGDFWRIERFCRVAETNRNDLLIILGDAGINYYNGEKDLMLKKHLEELPLSFLCIHGNHEQRPQNINGYGEINWGNGIVLAQEKYPSLLFAKDGQCYGVGSRNCFVIGGAYSVDKYYRLNRGYGWWPDEQPSPEIRKETEANLERIDWETDIVLSHTCPAKYIPTEAFLPMIDQRQVDRSTEDWLDTVEDKLNYNAWFCGHWHISKTVDRIRFMYEDFYEL
jgi:3-oxoacid CoA-transferase subunit A